MGDKNTKKLENFSDKQTVYNRELTKENKEELIKLNEEAMKLAEQIDVQEEDFADKLEAQILVGQVLNEKEDIIVDKEPISKPVADESLPTNCQNEKVEEILPSEKSKLPEKKAKKKFHIPQPIKYAICTASAGLIEFITFSILAACMKQVPGTIPFGEQNLAINNFVPTFIALLLSVLWNFTINRKFTFKSAGNIPRAMFLAFLFYVPFFPFKLWFNGTMPAHLVGVMGDGAQFFIEVCSMLINGVLEFCWQKFVIYRKEENTAVKKEK